MDSYEILGIKKTATKEEIKTSYRALAKKYHPDVNDAANASAFFRLIESAYQELYFKEENIKQESNKKQTQETGDIKKENKKPYQKGKVTCKNVIHFFFRIPLHIFKTLVFLLGIIIAIVNEIFLKVALVFCALAVLNLILALIQRASINWIMLSTIWGGSIIVYFLGKSISAIFFLLRDVTENLIFKLY